MKKANKAVIKAAEELYDGGDASYVKLLRVVGEMRAAREARNVIEEPPVGSKVEDRDGDVWTRHEDGWQLRPTSGRHPWNKVRVYAPLRLLPADE